MTAKSTTRLNLDPLEDRSLLAASAWVSAAGVLTVQGTAYGDAIVVKEAAGSVSVYAGPSSAATVKRIPINYAGFETPAVGTRLIGAVKVWGEGGSDKINLTNAPHLRATVYGGTGNDTVWGGTAADELHGGDNNDVLYGNGGDDMLYGGSHNDYLNGGPGTDFFQGNDGFDRFKDDFDLRYPYRDGISRLDVIQGQAGTCVINAAMAEAASGLNLYSTIAGRGTAWTVRLWNNGRASDQRVTFDGNWDDRDCLPGQIREADGTPTGFNNGEFWTVLYQRAFLKYCGVNWSNANSDYWTASRYNFKDARVALAAVSGWNTGREAISNAESVGTASALRTSVRAGELVIAGGTGHAYAVVDCFQSAAGAWYVKLYNPWGKDDTHRYMNFGSDTYADDGQIVVSWGTFRAHFGALYYTIR
jgi:Ca2+-binding RTX toxin-like protein